MIVCIEVSFYVNIYHLVTVCGMSPSRSRSIIAAYTRAVKLSAVSLFTVLFHTAWQDITVLIEAAVTHRLYFNITYCDLNVLEAYAFQIIMI